MLDDVEFWGLGENVAVGLTELFSKGAGEIIADPMVACNDPAASRRRTLK